MAALDTNVLVRFLVRDDHGQFRRTQAFLEQCVADGEVLFIPITVMLELEWVLRSRFGFNKTEIFSAFFGLLSSPDLYFESDEGLEHALDIFVTGAADFSDCVHIALAAQAGQTPLWTFDRQASRLEGAKLLG